MLVSNVISQILSWICVKIHILLFQIFVSPEKQSQGTKHVLHGYSLWVRIDHFQSLHKIGGQI